jgi:uncharacterized protein (TIGR00251 family)
MAPPGFLRVESDGLLLSVKLQPRAARNEIGEPFGNELRVKVAAPPVDSAANEALLRLLAEALDCARGRIELVRGHTSRHKVVRLRGIAVESALARLTPVAWLNPKTKSPTTRASSPAPLRPSKGLLGGQYTIGRAGETPTRSVGGHTAAYRANKP